MSESWTLTFTDAAGGKKHKMIIHGNIVQNTITSINSNTQNTLTGTNSALQCTVQPITNSWITTYALNNTSTFSSGGQSFTSTNCVVYFSAPYNFNTGEDDSSQQTPDIYIYSLQLSSTSKAVTLMMYSNSGTGSPISTGTFDLTNFSSIADVSVQNSQITIADLSNFPTYFNAPRWSFTIDETAYGGTVHNITIFSPVAGREGIDPGVDISMNETPANPGDTVPTYTVYKLPQSANDYNVLNNSFTRVYFYTSGLICGQPASNQDARIYYNIYLTADSWSLTNLSGNNDTYNSGGYKWSYNVDNLGGVTTSDSVGKPMPIYNNSPIAIDIENRSYNTPIGIYGGSLNSNICFVAGTPVDTDQGPIPIEQLDHKTNTINGRPIVAISKITSTDSYLILLKANCLGPNQPSQDTTVSQLHKILYNGKMTAAQNLPNSNKIPYDGQPLYNVLLENYSTMTVNNLTVETLNPRSNIAILYKFITTNNIDTVGKNKLICLLNQKLEVTNNMRKAFFSNIMTMIMLNILLEPEQQSEEVTPYTVLKAFIPQVDIVPNDNIRSIF